MQMRHIFACIVHTDEDAPHSNEHCTFIPFWPFIKDMQRFSFKKCASRALLVKFLFAAFKNPQHHVGS
jgi:hypothetical protein